MTLPATGQISMNQVNTELGHASNATISLNQTDVRDLAEIPAGTISMDDLHGKSASGSSTPSLPVSVIQVFDSTGGWDTNGWWNDNNITIGNDATLANANIDNPNSGNPKQTTYLVGRNLSLGVPAGKILTNLKFEYRISATHTGDPGGNVSVDRISLFNNTTKIGSVKSGASNIGASSALVTYTAQGNSAYWGVTLTSTLVNSSAFGAGLVVFNHSSKGNYTVNYAYMVVTAEW